jgi:hypothetical protein
MKYENIDNEIKKMYTEDHLSSLKIAEILNVSKAFVLRHLRKMFTKKEYAMYKDINRKVYNKNKCKTTGLDDLSDDDLLHLFKDELICSLDISKYHTKHSDSTVGIRLKQLIPEDEYNNIKNKISITKTVDKRKATNVKKYGVEYHLQQNINHFNIWNDNHKFSDWLVRYAEINNIKPTYKIISDYFNVGLTGVSNHVINFNCKHLINFKDSFLTTKLKVFFNDNNIDYISEFSIRKDENQLYKYDFKVGNILIEVNDTRTHNSTKCIMNGIDLPPKHPMYHYDKTCVAIDNGFDCIHLWEKDYDNLDEILHRLLPYKKVGASKLKYKHDIFVKDFIIKNHRQHTCFKRNGGALIDRSGNIIGAITFRKDKDNQILDKLCFKKGVNIIGGFEKLLKNYIKNSFDKDTNIVSYCDLDINNGNSYDRVGFKVVGWNRNYYWVNDDEWRTRRQCQKKYICNEFDESFDLTENEIMQKHGFVKVFTSGINTLNMRV